MGRVGDIKTVGTQVWYFLGGYGQKEISEKRNFFINSENFQRDFFWGQVPTESLRNQESEFFLKFSCYDFAYLYVLNVLSVTCLPTLKIYLSP